MWQCRGVWKSQKTTSAWRESLELIIRWVSYSCGSKQAVLFSLLHHIPILFSLSILPWQFTWPLLGHLPDCLICCYMSSSEKFSLLSGGSLLWGWMPDRKEKRRPWWEEEEETKHWRPKKYKTKKKKQRLQSSRGRGGVRIHGFQLCQFAGENPRKALRKHTAKHTHFPSHQKNCTRQQLMAATAGSCAEEHAALFFFLLCIGHVGAHPRVKWDKSEHRACRNFTL